MPFPIAGDLPDPEIELASPGLLYWQADSLPLSHLGRDMKHPLMICPSLIYNDVKNWVKGIRNSLVYCLSSISNFNKYFYILLFPLLFLIKHLMIVYSLLQHSMLSHV